MKPRLFKWLLRSLAALAALLLLCVIVLAVIFNTRPGTRWALERAAGMIPGNLAVESFDGTLWRGLHAVNADYSQAGFELRVEGLATRLEWAALARGRVLLPELSARMARVRLIDMPDRQPRPLELDFAPLPRPAAIEHATIARLVVEDPMTTRQFRRVELHDGSVEADRLRIGELSVEGDGLSVRVTRLDMRWSGDAPARLELAWTLAEPQLSGHGPVHGSLAELAFEQSVLGAYPARVSGTARILRRTTAEYDLHIEPAGWPIGQFTINGGTLHIAGAPDQYRTEFDIEVAAPEWTAAQVIGSGHGDLESLSNVEVNMRSTIGSASLAGRLGWHPEITAQFTARVSDADASILHPELAGRLQGSADITLTGPENVELAGAQVNGFVNDMPLSATGSLSITPEQVKCTACMLISGTNNLALDGGIEKDRLDFQLKIDAPSLHQVWPDLAGSLRGHGRLEGVIALPVFDGKLIGSNLAFGAWSADTLTLDSHSSSTAETNLELGLAALRFSEYDLGAIIISGRGTTDVMDVELDWSLAGTKILARVGIETSDGKLNGTVWNVSIMGSPLGEWALLGEPAFQVRLAEGSAEIGPHAWRGGGELRIDRLSNGANGLEFAGRAENIPLQMANLMLPSEYRMLGSVNADVDIKLQAGVVNGAVNWRQSGTVLHVQQQFSDPVDIRVPVFDIDVQLANGGAQAAAAIGIEPGVSGTARVDLERLSPDSAFTAALNLSGDEWAWLPAILPQVDQFAGTITADMTASGTLQEPVLGGWLKWRDGRVHIPALNAPIDQISIDLEGKPDGTAAFSGLGRAGTGSVAVQGRVTNYSNRDMKIRMQLEGDGAELLNWPEYRVQASPDLTIEGDRLGWTVNGRLQVPVAEITVKELPAGAVKPSADVRIVGETAPGIEAAGYSGTVELELGEKVHINVFGLDTRLSGQLRFRVPRGRPPGADGQVTLVGGVFSAYGQKLSIDLGTLTFTGPLDDPLVDVRAVRVIETLNGKVTAGIHLRGRAQNLTSSVYSQPAMAEADALSYLVLGRPLSQATSVDGSELSNAAVALGLGQTTRITERIANTLGLDQFTLAGDGGSATALVAGKQINPRLYTRYAYGVFSRIGTLLMRYRLSRRLTLEASAGEIQSIDLLYTIEKP